jgi:glycosyltransferase involved in cell wall biosynthesis
MVNDMTVDVIIPAFNASRYIGETIQSVLNQTYQPRKIIVIDDGSTDDTRSIVRSFDNDLIDLISVENGGVAFLDADDVWRADKIALQIEALKQHPDAKVVYSGTSLINDVSLDIPDSTGVPYIRCDVFEDILFFERPVFGSASSVMVYRSTLNRTDLFDESMSFSEDVDLWEEPCVRIRVHQDSVTRSKNWHKDVLVILQHFYYVNKFAGGIDLPEFNLLIHRRRIIRLFFSKNSKISYYFTFCNKFSQMAPFLFKQMGGSVFRVSFEVFKILWEEALSRVKDRLLFSQRLRLFLSEGTLFFSNSKAYNKDCEFNRRKK